MLCTQDNMTNRQEYTTGRQDDMTNWQDDRTIRQDDRENRHRVIFGPRYHSMAPGSPSLLVNRVKSEKGAFILV